MSDNETRPDRDEWDKAADRMMRNLYCGAEAFDKVAEIRQAMRQAVGLIDGYQAERRTDGIGCSIKDVLREIAATATALADNLEETHP